MAPTEKLAKKTVHKIHTNTWQLFTGFVDSFRASGSKALPRFGKDTASC